MDSAFSVDSKYVLELERRRARLGSTAQDSANREAEKARLRAEQQAIVDRVQASQVATKTDYLSQMVQTQKNILGETLRKTPNTTPSISDPHVIIIP